MISFKSLEYVDNGDNTITVKVTHPKHRPIFLKLEIGAFEFLKEYNIDVYIDICNHEVRTTYRRPYPEKIKSMNIIRFILLSMNIIRLNDPIRIKAKDGNFHNVTVENIELITYEKKDRKIA
jgi:hypothetical protein